ncbi:MAG TPA: SGNH/GDSL hydrolase family protein, partial [Bacteroidia bacterium]|nr:SGNH/GDSL hydrolase family protein [Bacteroidia bacterium]
MKKTILLLLTILNLFVAYGQKRKVLFIGNSYTRVNDLPLITSGIAMNMGDTLVYDVSYPDGYTLEQHFTNSTTLNKIKAGGWDYVVLQEQSQRPSFPEYDFFWAID